MKIGFFQFDILHAQPDLNRTKVEDRLEGHSFDLILLPELFTTGYLFEDKNHLLPFAETIPEGPTTHFLSRLAKKHKAWLAGGIIEIFAGKLYNTTLICGPEGYLGKQRKVHLTRYEKALFEGGGGLKVFELGGVKTGVLTCFDSWFPEAARQLARQGAQILLQPAAFGGPWTLDIIRVRAMENVVYTLTSNRIGQEAMGEMLANFRGESRIISPDGEILHQAGTEEELAFIEIDPERACSKHNVMCDDLFEEAARYDLKEE